MRHIWITIKKELRSIIRDKKSLLMMALAPLFIPIFVILMANIYDVMMEEDDTVYKVGINYNLNTIENDIISQYKLETIRYDSENSLEKAYENNEIVAYIVKKKDKYWVYNNSQSEDGSYVGAYITSYLETYNNYLGRLYLEENDIDSSLVYNNISYELVELQGESILANQVINMAIIFTIMGITLTAICAATDLTAGEKERGTLETLLTYPVKSSEIIIGKYVAILVSTVITLFVSIILAFVSLWYVKNNFLMLESISLNFNISAVFLTFIVLFTYALFISGLCIAIASFAKSFKEAQSMLTPISLFICVPMFLEMLDTKFGIYVNIIPILNHSFVINDIFSGKIDIFNILIVIISSIIYTCLLIFIIIKQYKSEKILFSN